MNKAATVSDTFLDKPTWCRVHELADIVRVFEEGVQVCTWQRELDPLIGRYLGELEQGPAVQVIESGTPDSAPTLACLPEHPGRTALINDLSMLSEIMVDLLGCDEIGLRLASVRHAMCPGWHVDQVGLRLVCTYHGPGTEWLVDQVVERDPLETDRLRDAEQEQARAGDVVLLKGSGWQGNHELGAIHRSPDPVGGAGLRTLVTLDPLWRT